MKFRKEKRSHMEGHTEVVFVQVQEGEEALPFPPFQIVCDFRGVCFKGNSTYVPDIEALQSYAKLISEAWEAHRSLVPKIVTPEGVEIRERT